MSDNINCFKYLDLYLSNDSMVSKFCIHFNKVDYVQLWKLYYNTTNNIIINSKVKTVSHRSRQ